GNQRTIGPLQRPRHEGVLLAFGTAKVVTEILAHLRVRITDAVFVIFGGNHGQRIGLIAPFLEIEPGDLAKYSGKAAVYIGLLPHVGGLQQVPPDLRRWRHSHLFDAYNEYDTRCASLDRLDPLMDRGGARGTCIFDPGRTLKAQLGRSLQDQRGGKILRGKSRIKVPEHDLVDILGANPRVRKGSAGDPYNQALNGLAGKLTERRMGPTDDTGGH